MAGKINVHDAGECTIQFLLRPITITSQIEIAEKSVPVQITPISTMIVDTHTCDLAVAQFDCMASVQQTNYNLLLALITRCP